MIVFLLQSWSVPVNKLSLGKLLKRLKLRDWFMFLLLLLYNIFTINCSALYFLCANKKYVITYRIFFSLSTVAIVASIFFMNVKMNLSWVWISMPRRLKPFSSIIRNLLYVFLLKYLNGQLWRRLSDIVVNATRLNVLCFWVKSLSNWTSANVQNTR